MKITTLIPVLFLLLLSPETPIAQETVQVQVQVTWDANNKVDNEANGKENWQKVYFYISDTVNTFDYAKPVKIVDQQYDEDGNSIPIETIIEYPAEAFVNKTMYLVARAYAEIDSKEHFSEDSEVATWESNMTRPAKAVLQMEVVGDNYIFTWNNTDPERIVGWNLQRSMKATGDYEVIRTISHTDPLVNPPAITVPVTELWDGVTNQDQYVTVVSFTKWGIYSRWADPITVLRPIIITIDAPQGVAVIVINK